MMGKVEAYFKMAERKTTFSQELRGGVATFLVNPLPKGIGCAASDDATRPRVSP